MNILIVMCVLLFLQIPNSNVQSDKLLKNKEDQSQEKNYFKVHNDSSNKEKAVQIHVTSPVQFTSRTTNLKELTNRSDISSEETKKRKKMNSVKDYTYFLTTTNKNINSSIISQTNTLANKLNTKKVHNSTLQDVSTSPMHNTTFLNNLNNSGDLTQWTIVTNITEITNVQQNRLKEFDLLSTIKSRESSVNSFTFQHTAENTSAKEREVSTINIVTKMKVIHNNNITKSVADVGFTKSDIYNNNTSEHQDTRTIEVKPNAEYPNITTSTNFRRGYLPDVDVFRKEEYTTILKHDEELRAGPTLGHPVKRMFNTKVGFFPKRHYDKYSFDSEEIHHPVRGGPRINNKRDRNKERKREEMMRTIKYGYAGYSHYGVTKDKREEGQTSNVMDKVKSDPRDYVRDRIREFTRDQVTEHTREHTRENSKEYSGDRIREHIREHSREQTRETARPVGKYDQNIEFDTDQDIPDRLKTTRDINNEGSREHTISMGRYSHHEANRDDEDQSRNVPDKSIESFRPTTPMSTPKSSQISYPAHMTPKKYYLDQQRVDYRTIATPPPSKSVLYGEVETDVTEDQWAYTDTNYNKNSDPTNKLTTETYDFGEETGAAVEDPHEDPFKDTFNEENHALRSTKVQKTTRLMEGKTGTTEQNLDYKMDGPPSECRVLCDGEEFTETKLAWKHRCRTQPNGYDCNNGGTMKRYYFSLTYKACVVGDFGKSCPFNYLNKFETLNDCYWRCNDVTNIEKQQLVPPKVFCKFQPQYGSCDEYHPRWYYDLTSRKCVGFSYSGCGGNVNRFTTNEECNKTCSGFDKRGNQALTTKVAQKTC